MNRDDVFAAYREAEKIEIEAFSHLVVTRLRMEDDQHAEFVYKTARSLKHAWYQVVKDINNQR